MRSTILAASILVAAIRVPAMAAPPPPIIVNDQKLHQPAIRDKQGRIYVPIRGVLEAFHTLVTYTAPRIVVVRKDGRVIAGLIVAQQAAILHGQTHQFSAAPIRHMGHIYVPLRTIAEIAGASVLYIRQPPQVYIRLPEANLLTTAPVPPVQPVQTNPAPPWWEWVITGTLVLAFLLESYRRLMRSKVTRHTS